MLIGHPVYHYISLGPLFLVFCFFVFFCLFFSFLVFCFFVLLNINSFSRFLSSPLPLQRDKGISFSERSRNISFFLSPRTESVQIRCLNLLLTKSGGTVFLFVCLFVCLFCLQQSQTKLVLFSSDKIKQNSFSSLPPTIVGSILVYAINQDQSWYMPNIMQFDDYILGK